MKCTLMLLIGLPAVGKSTFARALANNNDNDWQNYTFIHVNFDQIMAEWKPTVSIQWKDKRQSILEKINGLIKDLLYCNQSNSNILNGKIEFSEQANVVIIIDDNMYYKSMRMQYYRLAQSLNCGFCQVYFRCELQLSLASNQKRPQNTQVPSIVIENIFMKMEIPNLLNKWEKNSLFIMAFEKFDNLKLITMLNNVFEEILTMQPIPSTSSPKVSTKNTLHILDLTMRKHISMRVVQEKPHLTPSQLSSFISLLLAKKSTILLSVKNGDILLPKDNIAEFVDKAFKGL